jgi:hypothetical protein
MGALFYPVQPILLIPGPGFSMEIGFRTKIQINGRRVIASVKETTIEVCVTYLGVYSAGSTQWVEKAHSCPYWEEWLIEWGFDPVQIARILGREIPHYLEDYW